MTKFSDQLFDDLMREHGPALRAVPRTAPPPPRLRANRPAWLTAGAATVVGAVTGGLVLFGGGSPAYAVTENPDGTVGIKVGQLSALKDVNVKLKSLGLPIVAVPAKAGCVDIGMLVDKSAGHVPITASGQASSDGSITVDVEGVPKGDKALVTFEATAGGGLFGSIAIIKDSTKVPPCVTLPDPNNPGPGTTTGNQNSGGTTESSK
jgi:hypothetical protein